MFRVIGEVKSGVGENKQEIDQLSCTLIGDKKLLSLSHADFEAIRDFWKDNNLIWVAKQSGDGRVGYIGSRK